MRFFACGNAAIKRIHADGTAGIYSGGAHGIRKRNAHGNGSTHTVIEGGNASRKRTVCKNGAVSRYKNSKTAQMVMSIGFPCCFHAVADKNHALCAKEPEGSPYGGGGNVHAVTDKLCKTGGRIEGGADNAGCSVGEGRHGVKEVRYMVGAG